MFTCTVQEMYGLNLTAADSVLLTSQCLLVFGSEMTYRPHHWQQNAVNTLWTLHFLCIYMRECMLGVCMYRRTSVYNGDPFECLTTISSSVEVNKYTGLLSEFFSFPMLHVLDNTHWSLWQCKEAWIKKRSCYEMFIYLLFRHLRVSHHYTYPHTRAPLTQS